MCADRALQWWCGEALLVGKGQNLNYTLQSNFKVEAHSRFRSRHPHVISGVFTSSKIKIKFSLCSFREKKKEKAFS